MKKLVKFWPELFLLLVLVYFFRDTLFNHQIFVPLGLGLGDYNVGALPSLHSLSQSLKNGQIHLWNPYTFTGISQANGAIAAFNPVALLIFYLLPFPLGISLYLFLMFLILGVSTFYLARSFGLAKQSALVATLSLTFASGVVARMIHASTVGNLGYLVLAMLFTQKFFTNRRVIMLFLTSFVLALMILYVNQPAAFVCFFGFCAFFLFKAVNVRATKDKIKNTLLLAPVLLLCFLLAAIHLIPEIEMFPKLERAAGINDTVAKQYPFHLGELSYFLRPTPIGNPSLGNYDSPYTDPGIFWENTCYIGILGVALAFFALAFLTRTRKEVVFFGGLLFVTTVLALGKATPFFFIQRIPPFSFFRIYSRFLLLGMLSLSILAGFGFEALLQKLPGKRNLLGFMAAGIIVADLFSFALPYNARYDSQKWLAAPKTVEMIKNDHSFYRIYSLGDYEAYYWAYRNLRGWQKDVSAYANIRELLPPSIQEIFGLYHAGSPLGISGLSEWQSLVTQNVSLDLANTQTVISPLGLKMLRMTNTKYLTTIFPVKNDKFTLLQKIDFPHEQPPVYQYELPSPLPHAFVVHQSKTITASKDILAELTREEFDPLKLAVVNEEINLKSKKGQGEAVVVDYQPGQVTIKTKTETDGLVILTDTYDPGWQVRIDNRATKIYQADYLFRAVKVDPGEHTIIFTFKPRSFDLGLKITLISLVLSLIGAVVLRKVQVH